jgi:acyltransferase
MSALVSPPPAVPHAAVVPPQDAAGRLGAVDAARAVGILLIMAGHLPGLPEWLMRAIYSMHVPLFFWLSGWLLEPRRLAAPASAVAAGVGRSLLVPYGLFFLVSWLYWLATRGLGERAAKFAGVAWHDPWLGFLQGIGPAMPINPTLWFFPCLVVTVLAFHLSARAVGGRVGPGRAVLVALAAFGVLALVPAPAARWPWGLDIVPAALGFYALGHACRGLLPHLGTDGVRRAALAVLVGIGPVWAWAAARQGPVDLQHLAFGDGVPGFVAVALAGIACCVALGRLLPDVAPVRWLGRNTLILFPTHVLAYNLLSGVGKLVLGLSPAVMAGPAWQVALFAVTLAMSVPTVWVFRHVLARIDRALTPAPAG